MGCSASCRPSACGIAVFGAFALAVLIGILFGFGLLPLFDGVVYLLVGLGVVFAGLLVAAVAVGTNGDLRYRCCLGRSVRLWAVGAIGTIASALAVLSLVGIVPAWLGGVLVGLLTLFVSLLLIAVVCWGFCLAGAYDCTDADL